MAKSDQQLKCRGIATGFGILAMAVLFGCTPPQQVDRAAVAPTAQQSAAQPSAAQPSGPASAAPAAPSAAAGTASGAPRGGRPTINALRSGLFVYFRDDEDLNIVKAQTAADCAAYPSYQELSPASLTQLAKQNPAGMSAADLKVFHDVVTECTTSANGS